MNEPLWGQWIPSGTSRRLLRSSCSADSCGKTTLGLCWGRRGWRWELPQDWGFRQTWVWHPYLAVVSPVSRDKNTSSYTPPPTSLQIILWAPNTYSSPLLPLQMRNVSSASSPRHASLCLWQPLTALSPPYPHIPLPKCSPTPPHWAVPVPISSQKG